MKGTKSFYGYYIEEAIEWCLERDLEFIDCHNLGGMPNEDEIYAKANERRRELQSMYKNRSEDNPI